MTSGKERPPDKVETELLADVVPMEAKARPDDVIMTEHVAEGADDSDDPDMS